ncbi:MAG: Gfo/Idh/MocA family oxidoreductase [candidate division Zixibacteria bacterium]|nr:Gfo/Idh/MocA family oxidoreductase [candidate division Zixibacteria bacterium]
MEKIGVGVIGCGVMGKALAVACNRLEHAVVKTVCDVNEEMAKQAAAELGAIAFSDYHRMLEREDVQAVLIAVPGFLHEAPAVAAAQAGKHVFSEKPMAVSLAACDAMIAACDANRRILGVGHVCRFHGVHSQIKRMVVEGRIGTPTCMTVRRLGGGWSGVWAQKWRLERAKSGGTLMEVNAHEIDFMRWVCGDVKRVTAQGGQFREKQTDFEDIMLVILEFENGALGLLHSSNASTVGEYGGRLDGSEGSLHFASIWGENAGIRHARFGEEAVFLPLSEIVVEEPVQAELRGFIDAICHKVAPPVTGRDGRAVVEIALAAYESAKTGKPVDLPV